MLPNAFVGQADSLAFFRFVLGLIRSFLWHSIFNFNLDNKDEHKTIKDARVENIGTGKQENPEVKTAGRTPKKRLRKACVSDEKEVHVEIGPVDENEKSNTPIGAALSADDATVRDLVGDALAQTLRLSWLLWSAIWQ
ncbi:hypothetical protein F2Q68_00034834 [Brassica cretica]|uniref:Uncharacterized protein n=1 Tax=Brassica cretica TaxID=69181 RepID=A0A8S9H2U9_BRACR|nr:hypothetical protein F2Q68_00034834 [Brassica cretica]